MRPPEDPSPPPRRPAYGSAEKQPSSYGHLAHQFVIPNAIRLVSTGAVESPWRRRNPPSPARVPPILCLEPRAVTVATNSSPLCALSSPEHQEAKSSSLSSLLADRSTNKARTPPPLPRARYLRHFTDPSAKKPRAPSSSARLLTGAPRNQEPRAASAARRRQ